MVILTVAIIAHVGAEVEIALEAELANVIQAPMVIAEDKLVSGGKYVWMEGAPLTGGGDQGWVEFIINLPESGEYALWGHTFAWDGNSDSFWVTWQPADPDENAQQTKNTQYRWSIGTKNQWHWDRINHWLNAGTFDREWKFDKAGETVLRIAVRKTHLNWMLFSSLQMRMPQMQVLQMSVFQQKKTGRYRFRD